MSDLPSAKMKRRTSVFVMMAMLVFAGGLIVNLFKISITNNKKYQELANKYHFGSITISANRGTIYDSNNKVLAQSATVFKVYIDPSMFRSELEDVPDKEKEKMQEALKNGQIYSARTVEQYKEDVAEFLSSKLEIDKSKIFEAIDADTQYRILKAQVEKNVADEITLYMTQNDIGSIRIEEDTKRYYPKNELAASVIGFTNVDGGQYGIESYYDDYLAGTDGKVISAMDGKGNEMPYRYSKTFDAQPGNSVYLTIDSTLQYYLEKNLNEMVTTHKVKDRACGIIMNAKTGAILAMSTWPSYNLNEPREISNADVLQQLSTLDENSDAYKDIYNNEMFAQWKNKAVNEIYIPGSVFKVITSSAALEEGKITVDSTFTCTGAATVVDGVPPIRCWKTSGHGTQNFNEALKNSCNPAFIEIGRRLGIDNFVKYFKAFGLDEKTGIDLPGESSSIYLEADEMGPVELASVSFGQTTKLTPMEMITAYAAVINGGKLLTPYVVDKVVDNDGNVVLKNDTVVKRQVISEDTSATMRSSLEYVVNNNGGSNAYIKGYHIGGKSGTSERIDVQNSTATTTVTDENGNEVENSDDDSMTYVASYGCFAPADDPEIMMLILADNPTGGDYYGSVVVVPYARKIMEEALPYLGYYPEYTDEEIATLDVSVPLLEGKNVDEAKSTLEQLGLSADVVGGGTTVVAQVPVKGSRISKEGTVVIYTEENYTSETSTVPNVIGMNLEDVNYMFAQAGLNYTTSGASAARSDSVVQLQSVNAGETLPKGSIVELTFVINDQSG